VLRRVLLSDSSKAGDAEAVVVIGHDGGPRDRLVVDSRDRARVKRKAGSTPVDIVGIDGQVACAAVLGYLQIVCRGELATAALVLAVG
jgi:hypothetical protein